MFLKQAATGHLVEVLDLNALIDPFNSKILGRLNVGEDLPDPEPFAKTDLRFPSGEFLPGCWVDAHYRDDELRQ